LDIAETKKEQQMRLEKAKAGKSKGKTDKDRCILIDWMPQSVVTLYIHRVEVSPRNEILLQVSIYQDSLI
jgi:hypothetical protein